MHVNNTKTLIVGFVLFDVVNNFSVSFSGLNQYKAMLNDTTAPEEGFEPKTSWYWAWHKI